MKNIIKTYDYTNQVGRLLYQIVRFEPKDFRQRRHDGNGGWLYNLQGVERTIFRLPVVTNAIQSWENIYIVEGEKDVLALEEQGFVATCNSGGAGKWLKKFGEYFRGAHVVIIPDNDPPGRKHALDVATSCYGKAESVRIVELPGLPEKGDVSDWLALDHTAEELRALVEHALPFEPAAAEPGPEHWTAREKLEYDPLEFTDVGDAARIAENHGFEIRYNHEPFGRWFCYNGTVWERDTSQKISKVIHSSIGDLLRIAANCTDGDRRRVLVSHAQRLSGVQKQKNVLYMLSTRPELQIVAKDLDAHPYLLNTINYTLDLESGDIVSLPHRREDYLTACAPVEYQPGATCPAWLLFLDRIFNGDAALIQFMARIVGYSLTGDTSEQCFFFCYGTGSNGKTVFFETLSMLFGEDYGIKSNIEIVLLQRQARETHGLAQLMGKRFCVLSEIPAGRRLNESVVKDLTGGDSINARNLYEKGFSFHPQAKFFLYGNHKPGIGDGMAIWRRVMELPFTVTIPKAEQIPMRDFLGLFRAELPGILNWALEGYCSYREQGLRTPDAVTRAVNEYREESDTLHRFMEEHCEELAILSTPCKAMYARYSEWCEENGEHPISMRALNTKFKERGFEIRTGTGNRLILYGAGLRELEK